MTELTRLSCTVAEAVETLKDLWVQTSAGSYALKSYVNGNSRLFSARECQPFRASGLMQWGWTDNPLWEIVQWMPCRSDGHTATLYPDGYGMALNGEWMSKIHKLGITRTALCRTYAFSIMSPSDIEWLSKIVGVSSVVEINAGRGYWAWQLEQIGVNVAAYDPHVPGEDNEYFRNAGTFTTVTRRDHTAVELHPDRVMLTVWPDYDADYAARALELYRGDVVVYAGEGPGGCTADDEFHTILERDWEWLSSSPGHVTWWGVNCHLDAYVRKTKIPPK